MRKEGLLDLYILEILDLYSNDERRLTQKELSCYLQEHFNCIVSRKTIGVYLRALREEGYINGNRGVYRAACFSAFEYRVIRDCILEGLQLSLKESQYLQQKLKKASLFRRKWENPAYAEGGNSLREGILHMVWSVFEVADKCNQKISFVYGTYKANGDLVPGRTYLVSPYHLLLYKSRYYLLGPVQWENDIRIFEVRRIINIKLVRQPRVQVSVLPQYENGFSPETYVREHVDMKTGGVCMATVEIMENHMDTFISWYGNEYTVFQNMEDAVIVRFPVAEDALCDWGLLYADVAEVLGPEKVRRQIVKKLKMIQSKYMDKKT